MAKAKTTPATSFPKSLKYDDDMEWWAGTAKLLGFAALRIAMGRRRSATKQIHLFVPADEDGPTDAQVVAYRYCLNNQPSVVKACLRGLTEVARKSRAAYEGMVPEQQLEKLLPKKVTAEQLESRVRLASVQVTDREKQGVAYIEYDFNCAWDDEHGLLIVLHKDRLVYSGGSGDGWKDR
ncbi:MAG TPA: hypothetical protein VF624_08355 [Tepidisphaeraceae bacterium]|jgi:hypothetical protein